jgi:hypothetical protein
MAKAKDKKPSRETGNDASRLLAMQPDGKTGRAAALMRRDSGASGVNDEGRRPL